MTVTWMLERRMTPFSGKSPAVAHSLFVAIYYMLRDHVPYQELGAEYFDQLHTLRLQRHHVRRLEELGFAVTVTAVSWLLDQPANDTPQLRSREELSSRC
jgi:hypothetical protein